MQFIDVIVGYLNNTATEKELEMVYDIVEDKVKKPKIELTINEAHTKDFIIKYCKRDYLENNSKLRTIKFLKEMTGMGLKDAKDYCDANIF